MLSWFRNASRRFKQNPALSGYGMTDVEAADHVQKAPMQSMQNTLCPLNFLQMTRFED